MEVDGRGRRLRADFLGAFSTAVCRSVYGGSNKRVQLHRHAVPMNATKPAIESKL